MEKEIYVIVISWDCGNGADYEVHQNYYKTLSDAQEAQAKLIEEEMKSSWIRNYDKDELKIEKGDTYWVCNVNEYQYWVDITIHKIVK